MSFIDDDTVVFHTSYDSWIFREEIRLIDDDRARLRQTVAWRNGDVKLVGQYYEYRCHDDSNVRLKSRLLDDRQIEILRKSVLLYLQDPALVTIKDLLMMSNLELTYQ